MSNVDPLNPNAEYDVPKGDSKYLKFEEGETEFFPVGSAIIGWEYWNTDNKPVRMTEKPEGSVQDLPKIRADQYGNFKVNHFWVFPVIDCNDGKVKILEITQSTVQTQIRKYTKNPKWGSPVMKYTLTVDRDESGQITKYSVMANPLPEIPKAWISEWERVQKAGFDLRELFSNGDPFAPKNGGKQTEADRQFEGVDPVAEDEAEVDPETGEVIQ